MKWIVKSLAAVSLMAAFVSAAETMEETVSKLGAAAGKAYVAPIVSGFGTNMNAGWYHKAPSAQKLGFHVELGSVFMGTWLSGGKKTLNVTGSFTLDSARAQGVANASVDTSTLQGKAMRDSLREGIRRSQQDVTFDGPTVIGSKKDVMTIKVVSQSVTVGKPGGGGDTTITTQPYNDSIKEVTGILGNFTNIPLPLFAPQLTLGTVYGTNVTLRYLPEVETVEEVGKVSLFGFGIQHNPAVWGFLPPLPLDVSVGYFTQSLKVGTLLEARSQAFNINASKQFGFRFMNVTPYGGIQYETSSFDFSYDLDVDGEQVPVSFTAEGANHYRATAGVSIRLLAININGDYNVGKYQSFSAGVMVGL